MNSKQRRGTKRVVVNETVLPTVIEPPNKAELKNEINLTNGFGEAIGFGQQGFPGGHTYQQVESSTTIFENLRWYLVSNFRQMLSQAYVEIGLVQTICDVPVDDGLRAGFILKSKQLDEDQIEELMLFMDREKDVQTAGQAAKWNRLFGGAGILTLIGDQDPVEELNVKSIGKDTEVNFRAVDMWELFWDMQNLDGYDPAIQEHEFEFYNYYSEQVHKSRVMKLMGIQAPSFIRPRLRGWGVSRVETLVRSINQYLKTTDLTFEVLDEFKLDVYKIKNMVNTLLAPNGTQKIKERVQLANWQKNYQNALVMDAEDDFDHKQLSFAGLAEAMEQIRMQVAADMRMPITKLFGTTANKGLGGTDQNDMENYNSMVESDVRFPLKYDILRMAEIRCQQRFGFIPDDLSLTWNPLRELSSLDDQTVKTQKFTRLLQAKEAGEITTEEFRDACNKGNLFDVPLDTTDAGLNALDEEVAEDAAMAADLEAEPNDDNSETSPGEKKKVKNDKDIQAYTSFEKAVRVFNSADYDKASYEADGGDGWIDPRRKDIFGNPLNVDKDIWTKAKYASIKAMGEERWQFVVWMYKKMGGEFT